MGQQQLLLLVLATVIVGLATVAGIQAFEQGSKRAQQDALTQTSVKIASDVQANLQKPEQFGGAGLDNFDNYESGSENDLPSLPALGYETEDGAYVTSDGKCTLAENGSVPEVTCESTSSDGARVKVEVRSLNSEGIVTTTQEFKSSGSSSSSGESTG